MLESRVKEISFEDNEIVADRSPRRIHRLPRTRRVMSLLVFPAWVVSNQTRTSHLHLANPLAAFECDGEDAEKLQQGFAYFFAFEVPIEIVDITPSLWCRPFYQDWDGDMVGVAYQMIWNPDFVGYHEKGRIVLPRGRGGKQTERHRWDMHFYERPGSGLKSAIRCSDDEVIEFGSRSVNNLAVLYDKETGKPHRKRLPWGFMSAIIDGRRMF